MTNKQIQFRSLIKELAEKAEPSTATSLNGIMLAGIDLLLDQSAGVGTGSGGPTHYEQVLGIADKSKQLDLYRDVEDFHKKYGIAYSGSPRPLPDDYVAFRVARLNEEVEEYKQAVNDGDLEGQLDALVDLIYIALGNAHLQGFTQFNEAWKRVHAANMKKELASQQNPGKYGKLGDKRDIVKPAGWVAPDLSDLVQ